MNSLSPSKPSLDPRLLMDAYLSCDGLANHRMPGLITAYLAFHQMCAEGEEVLAKFDEAERTLRGFLMESRLRAFAHLAHGVPPISGDA